MIRINEAKLFKVIMDWLFHIYDSYCSCVVREVDGGDSARTTFSVVRGVALDEVRQTDHSARRPTSNSSFLVM